MERCTGFLKKTAKENVLALLLILLLHVLAFPDRIRKPSLVKAMEIFDSVSLNTGCRYITQNDPQENLRRLHLRL